MGLKGRSRMQGSAERDDNADRRRPEAGAHAQWFALQTRSRHEKVVRDELAKRNIEHFLPTITRLSQWKDRKKQVEFPLFHGYCFARFPLNERLPVLQSTGVVRIVSCDGRPEPIPLAEIESLMLLMTNRARYDLHPFIKEGSLVEVVRGPLQGAKGRLLRCARLCRVVISISLIQQAVAVEIDSSCIAPSIEEAIMLPAPLTDVRAIRDA
jgi:transcription antitermination factor NusG